MNQIICTPHSNINITITHNNFRKKFLKLQFSALILVSISIITYYGYSRYDLYKKENFSKSIMDNYGITKIYSKNNDYNSELLNNTIFFYENSSFSVIGLIDIKDLNISYPILSDISKDFLKLSPCRFYGPMPNEIRKSLYCST